jgi:hypothetical protein
VNLTRRIAAVASAVLVAALAGPAGAALSPGDDVEVGATVPLVRHDPIHDGDENGELNADNPGDAEHSGEPEEPGEPQDPGDVENPEEPGNPGEVGTPGESGDPSEHDDSGDAGEDPSDHGNCTSVSSVAVCVDEPR